MISFLKEFKNYFKLDYDFPEPSPFMNLIHHAFSSLLKTPKVFIILLLRKHKEAMFLLRL